MADLSATSTKKEETGTLEEKRESSVKESGSMAFTVRGKVQGVYFRKYTKAKADELNLKGWVKNMADGSVQGVAQGQPSALVEMYVCVCAVASVCLYFIIIIIILSFVT